jgi:hypothetical protein
MSFLLNTLEKILLSSSTSTTKDVNKNNTVSKSKIVHFLLEDEILELNNINQFPNQNCAIAGTQGSGKTVTIKTIIDSYYKSINPKIIIIDYKDDYSRKNEFVNRINADEVLVDESPIPFNPLVATPIDKKPIRDVTYRFLSLVSSCYPIMGGKQKGELKGLLEEYLTVSKEPSVDGLVEFLESQDREYGAWYEEVLIPLYDFNIFTSEQKSIDSLYNTDKNMVVNVTRSSEEHKIIITLAIIFLLKQYMLGSNKAETIKGYRDINTLLVVDEASELMATSNNSEFKKFIEMAREYGFPFIFGFQSISELYKNKKIDWVEMVSLQMRGSSRKSEDTANLTIGEFIISSPIFNGKHKVIPFFKKEAR